MNSVFNLIIFNTFLRFDLLAVEEFARKAAEKRISHPLNVLWAYHFMADSPENSKLYEQLEHDFPTEVKTSFLGRYLCEEKNTGKLQQLLEFLKTKNESNFAIVNSVILESHLKEDRIQDALAMIENGTVNVEHIPKKVLNDLKNRIIVSGNKIPDSILHKNTNENEE